MNDKQPACLWKALNVKAQGIWLYLIKSKQGYAFKNWVDGLSDEAYYPWESPKKIWLISVNPTIATKQKKVLIHQKKLISEFFKTIENKQRLISFLSFSIIRSKWTTMILNFSNPSFFTHA